MPYTFATANILGRLGKDPDYRVTDTGVQVAEISVATKGQRKRNGQFEEVTFWHKIVAFKQLAEDVQRNFRKGDMIQLEGKIELHEWDDRDTGQRRYRTEIQMSSCTWIDSRPLDAQTQTSPGVYAASDTSSADGDRPF